MCGHKALSETWCLSYGGDDAANSTLLQLMFDIGIQNCDG